MLLEALRLVAAIAFLVVLPGILLSFALFPRKGELSLVERVYLTLAGGVLVLMTIGIVLGFFPHPTGRGAFQSIPLTGLPNVEIGMVGACVLFAWIAMRRGAFPALAARLPTSWRARATPRPQGPAPR